MKLFAEPANIRKTRHRVPLRCRSEECDAPSSSTDCSRKRNFVSRKSDRFRAENFSGNDLSSTEMYLFDGIFPGIFSPPQFYSSSGGSSRAFSLFARECKRKEEKSDSQCAQLVGERKGKRRREGIFLASVKRAIL